MASVYAVIAMLILRLMGWRFEGRLPSFRKGVVLGVPHTSNMDGVIMILVAFALRMRIYFLAKAELTQGLLGKIAMALGAIPLDRARSRNAVEQAVDAFKTRDDMFLVLAPEGTRKKVKRWKAGFYQIAMGAGVPIVLGFIDYKRKAAGVGPSLVPSGDIQADMEIIRAFYDGITARHPDQMGDIRISAYDARRRESAGGSSGDSGDDV